MKKIIIVQFVILLLGMLFAWVNFTIELFAWFKDMACPLGCSANGGIVNPFLTPCFYGALFFTIAFILSAILLAKRKYATN
jgi:hypothetical protein